MHAPAVLLLPACPPAPIAVASSLMVCLPRLPLQAATVLASRAQQGLLAAAWAQWQEVVAMRRQARLLLGKLARRTNAQLLASALRGWRQQVHRGRRLQRLETSLGARRQQAALVGAFKVRAGRGLQECTLFSGWRRPGLQAIWPGPTAF